MKEFITTEAKAETAEIKRTIVKMRKTRLNTETPFLWIPKIVSESDGIWKVYIVKGALRKELGCV